MKTYTLIGALALLSQTAQAEISLGDYGAIGFGANASIISTSNARLNDTNEGATSYRFSPKVMYRNIGGIMAIESSLGADFNESDIDELDEDNYYVDSSISFTGAEFYSLTLTGGFRNDTAADFDTQQIIERDTLNLGANGTYDVSEYVFLRGGVNYTKVEPQSSTTSFGPALTNMAETETFSIPVTLLYRYDETLNFGLGYKYTTADVSKVPIQGDFDTHAVFVSVEDLISPLVQYAIELGVQRQEFDDSVNYDDQTGAHAQIGITWFAREYTNVNLNVANDYTTSVESQSIQTLSAELSVNHTFNERFDASIAVRYEDSDYTQPLEPTRLDRNDQRYSALINASYRPGIENLILNASLRYLENDSNTAGSDYDVFDASISASYLF